MAEDLHAPWCELAKRSPQPSAFILNGRTRQSTPESGERASDDGDKRKKGSKEHVAVDPLGYLLALKVTAANEQERAQGAEFFGEVQAATGGERAGSLCRSR